MQTAPTAPAEGQMPSPETIFHALTAFGLSAAMRAAIDLDLFSAVAQGAGTAAELAAKLGASERGVRILSDYLTVHDFLTKEHGRYGLAPHSAAFLDKQSPAYMGTVAHFLTSDHIRDGFENLAEVVRKGTTQRDESALDADHPMWVEFARSMAPLMMMPAQMIAEITAPEGPKKVLDIAAGHGVFGVMVALRNPQARVIGLDWTSVLALARENAVKMGVGERWEALPGSAFDVDYGRDYDLVLVPNFLHHFNVPTNETLLRKVRSALRPGGQVAVMEFVPNEDRVSPTIPATFSMMMLAQTPSGDAYTFAELEGMLTRSEFSDVRRHDLLPSPQTLILARA